MSKTAYNWHAVLLTAYRLHAVLMTAYSWHAVLMTAFDSILHACSSIKSIQSTQSEQLTRTSQCLFSLKYSKKKSTFFFTLPYPLECLILCFQRLAFLCCSSSGQYYWTNVKLGISVNLFQISTNSQNSSN